MRLKNKNKLSINKVSFNLGTIALNVFYKKDKRHHNLTYEDMIYEKHLTWHIVSCEDGKIKITKCISIDIHLWSQKSILILTYDSEKHWDEVRQFYVQPLPGNQKNGQNQRINK